MVGKRMVFVRNPWVGLPHPSEDSDSSSNTAVFPMDSDSSSSSSEQYKAPKKKRKLLSDRKRRKSTKTKRAQCSTSRARTRTNDPGPSTVHGKTVCSARCYIISSSSDEPPSESEKSSSSSDGDLCSEEDIVLPQDAIEEWNAPAASVDKSRMQTWTNEPMPSVVLGKTMGNEGCYMNLSSPDRGNSNEEDVDPAQAVNVMFNAGTMASDFAFLDTTCMDEAPVESETSSSSSDEGLDKNTDIANQSHPPKDSSQDEGSNVDGNADREMMHVASDSAKQQKIRFMKSNEVAGILANAVLGRGPLIEEDMEAEDNAMCKLPLKFRFEDEVPKVVEKTPFEKEMEELMGDYDMALPLTNQQDSSRIIPHVNPVEESSHADETQDDRCNRGVHEWVLRDDEGLICAYCFWVELGPKDILPQWSEKARRKSKSKIPSYREELPVIDRYEPPSNDSSENKAVASHNIPSDELNIPSHGTVWSLKPGVRESMYTHQQQGFEFLWKNLAGSIDLAELKNRTEVDDQVGGCIISHAPGTGKTRLTIVFIETYLNMFPDCRPVVITPASTVLTWQEEFKKWNISFPFYNLSNPHLEGNESEAVLRALGYPNKLDIDAIRWVKIYSWANKPSILGLSYSLFEMLATEKDTKTRVKGKSDYRETLLEKPGIVVMDEGHYPRNKRSNIWNALCKLRTGKRVILSGTPFQNNIEELFNTLRLVRPAVADGLAKEKSSEVTDCARLEKLNIAMSPFVNVHKDTILQESLPGLRNCVIVLKPESLQKSLIETLNGQSGSTFKSEHNMALLSLHPCLFEHCDKTDLNKLRLNPNEGAKTKFVVELLRLALTTNEKVLIFSQYIAPLNLIKEQLGHIFGWVVDKQILHMESKLEQNQRQKLINSFNNPVSEAKVMLAPIKCCSEGISLVGASRVVLLDVVWNPSVERQAICRAYRMGQKKFVYAYHLVTSGTNECKKYSKQAEKERLSELLFTSPSEECETSKQQAASAGCIEDPILEAMVSQSKLTSMFEKIIHQTKETHSILSLALNPEDAATLPFQVTCDAAEAEEE